MTANGPTPRVLAPPATTVDAEGRHVLVVDVPCIQCEYNLRGLDCETVCPECGGTVERTLRGPWLRYADPRWLNRMRIGTLLLLSTAILSISIEAFWFMAPSWFGPAFVNRPFYAYCPLLPGVAFALLLLTGREPTSSWTREPSSVRRVVRCSAVLLPVMVATYWSMHLYSAGAWPTAVFEFIRSAAWIVARCGVLVILRRLASRMPSRSLARATTPAIWAYAMTYALLSLLTCYLMISTAASGPQLSSSMLFTVWDVARIVPSVVDVWIVVLLFLYCRRLKAELAKARRFAAEDFEPRQAPMCGGE